MKHLRRTSAQRTLGAGCLALVATLAFSLPALADDTTAEPATDGTVTSSPHDIVVPDVAPLPADAAPDVVPGPDAAPDNTDSRTIQPTQPTLTISSATQCGVKATYKRVGNGKFVAFRHSKVGYLESQWASHNNGTTRANRGTPNGTVVAELLHADRTPVLYQGQRVVSAPFAVTTCGDVPTLELATTANCTDDDGNVAARVAMTANTQHITSLVLRTSAGNRALPVRQTPFTHPVQLRAGATSTVSLSFHVGAHASTTSMPTRTYTVAQTLAQMPKCSEPRIVKGAYGTYCTRNGKANPIVRWEADSTVTNRAISASLVNADGTLGDRTPWVDASQDLLTSPLALTPGTYRLFAAFTVGGQTKEQRVDTSDFSIADRACPIDIAAQVSEGCTNGLRDVTLTALPHSSLEPRQYKLFGATTYAASTPAGELSHTFAVTPGRYYPQIVDNTYNFATSTPVIQVPPC